MALTDLKITKSTNDLLILEEGNFITSIISLLVGIPLWAYLSLVIVSAQPDTLTTRLVKLFLIAMGIYILIVFTKSYKITFDKIKNSLQIVVFTLFTPRSTAYELSEINKVYLSETSVHNPPEDPTPNFKYQVIIGLKSGGTISLGHSLSNYTRSKRIAESISNFLNVPFVKE
jgi:hypothetical protein